MRTRLRWDSPTWQCPAPDRQRARNFACPRLSSRRRTSPPSGNPTTHAPGVAHARSPPGPRLAGRHAQLAAGGDGRDRPALGGLRPGDPARGRRTVPDHQDHPGRLLRPASSPGSECGQAWPTCTATWPTNCSQPAEGRPPVDGRRRAQYQGRPGKPLSVDAGSQELLAESSGTQAVAFEDSAATIFRKRRSEAARYLVAAAMNITYPGEVPAGMDRRERVAALRGTCRPRAVLARSRHSDAAVPGPSIRRPTKSCGRSCCRRSTRLIEVNRKYWTTPTRRTRRRRPWPGCWCSLTGAALLAAIVGLKVLLFKRMRRVLNPPLLVAAAAGGGRLPVGARSPSGNRPRTSRWPSKTPLTASRCSKPRGPSPTTPTATKAAGCS